MRKLYRASEKKRHDLNTHERNAPAKSSSMKPKPPIGCAGKYFRDEKFAGEHKGIDTTYEHERKRK